MKGRARLSLRCGRRQLSESEDKIRVVMPSTAFITKSTTAHAEYVLIPKQSQVSRSRNCRWISDMYGSYNSSTPFR
jgi:hypothetical protein